MFKKKYNFYIPHVFVFSDGTTTKDPVIGFHKLSECRNKLYKEQKTICDKLEFQKSFLEKELSRLKDIEAQSKKANAELERFFLREIGNCKTVKQVKKVEAEYCESELGKNDPYITVSGIPQKKFFMPMSSHSKVLTAIRTKIKRLNEKNVMNVCKNLDNVDGEAVYARIMMNELKETAGIEADGKKIIDAWKSGMDAWGVFLSMLAEYKVRRDSIF